MVLASYQKLSENIYQIKAFKPGSHSYLITGEKNLLIDPGLCTRFKEKEKVIEGVGVKTRDIDLVVLSHEHFDHFSSAAYLAPRSIICAHKNAVKAIEDENHSQLFKACDTKPFKVTLIVEEPQVISAGKHSLKVVYTPGHSVGSMCLYDPYKKILFSGDSLFANGVLPYITPTGSLDDYISSLEKLKAFRIKKIFPGHGRVSSTGSKDIVKALKNALRMKASE